MMISDSERREVAARLRQLGGHVYNPDNVYELLAYALGVDDFEGTDELFIRLADLIEPSCDRDALLALEKVLHDMGNQYEAHKRYELGVTFRAIAARIREALGVRQGP